MSKKPRKQKSKKEIVSDIQLVQDAQRRRSLVRDILFPYLLKVDETISYNKVFLQAFSALVTGEVEKLEKKITVGELTPQLTMMLGEMFKVKDPEQLREFDRYMGLIKLLKDVSVNDLVYATELPRFIDGYLLKDKGKEKISIIPIDTILG